MRLHQIGLLALCAVVLTVHGAPFSADVATAKNSLQALGSLINMFSVKMFDSTAADKVTDVSNKVIDFVVPMLNLMEGADTTDTKNLRQQFATTHGQLEGIALPLDETKRQLQWTTTRAIYAQYEVFIVATSHILDNYVASSPNDRETRKRQFIETFLENRLAALHIYKAVVETDVHLHENLANAVVQYAQGYRRTVMNFMLAMDRLVLRGAQLQIAYERLVNGLQAAKTTETDWKARMSRMVARMNEIDTHMKNMMHSELKKDIPIMLEKSRGLSNQEFAPRVYNYLSDKFHWLHWISIAYNEVDVSDHHHHAMKFCDGVKYFRTQGRNLVIANSNPETSRFTTARGDIWLAHAESAAHRTTSAEIWLKEINNRVGENCDDAAFRGVFCWGCNVWWQAPPGRLAKRKITVGGDVNAVVFG